jgi:hypothetical protein
MSMDTAPENNLPETGLRLGGDAARERDALRRQIEECEDHNSELLGVLSAVRQWAATAHRAAINRLAQGSPDPRYWQGQLDAAQAVETLVKPAV